MSDEKKTTVTRTDAEGNEIEVEVGADGENPVSPNNPPLKATGYISEDAYKASLGESVVGEAIANEQEPVGDEEATLEAEGVEKQDAGQGLNPSAEDGEEEEDEAPAKSASKADWVDYAVSQGADREEAESSTRDDLAKTYGK